VDTKRAEELISELRDLIKQNYRTGLRYQYRNVSEAAEHLGVCEDGDERAETVRTCYDRLFPARGGLSDYVFWDPDPAVRAEINGRTEEIRRELYHLMEEGE